ncbi:radical SAM protein [Desulfatitalea alkaliphila]|uniref:Radical SAM protein n=1 Tax=Desulfatitalea alkaliphila TaxID=2929485 RepID=A0AA41QYQ7_9BACT|nr:radical SAM protein [Desulfatitalea alkaliphila]MCJ8498963.1 radical SAM protein [Desulfatitalea alkaliphila]
MKSVSPVSLLHRLHAWWEHRVLWEPKAWIQVEVTTACNAACTYCPRTVYRSRWHNRFLPLSLYRRLLPAFAKTELVYLQGWGEPLLHPDLPAMVALAKQAGARVGTTTNGMRLDAPLAEKLINAGLDLMAFSLAGAGTADNDRFRAGTAMETVLANIAMLADIKKRLGTRTPAIHIAYLMPASGMAELEALPSRLQGTAVEEVVVSLLDFTPDDDRLKAEVVNLDDPARRATLASLFERVHAAGQAAGITIHTPFPGDSTMETVCTENIQQALCVSADGEISPCMPANLPLTDVHHLIDGCRRPYRRLTFGNIGVDWLPVIWRRPAYVRFRAAHAQGVIPAPCAGCAKLRRLPRT